MLRLPPCRIVINQEDMIRVRRWIQDDFSRPLAPPDAKSLSTGYTDATPYRMTICPGPQRSRDASIVSCSTVAPMPSAAAIDAGQTSDATHTVHCISTTTSGAYSPLARSESDTAYAAFCPPTDFSLRASSPDISMSEHTLLGRALSASDGDPFSIPSEDPQGVTMECQGTSTYQEHPTRELEHVHFASIPHLSPLDELASRFQQLATQVPTCGSHESASPPHRRKRLLSGGVFYGDDESDRELLRAKQVRQSGRKRTSPSDTYLTPEVPPRRVYPRQAFTTPRRQARMDGADDSLLGQAPGTYMFVASERYPASSCSTLPDFDALAARDSYPSCALTPARRAPRTRRSPGSRRPPVVPVYDDNFPANMQAQTPADLRYSGTSTGLLMRSATGHVIPAVTSPSGHDNANHLVANQRSTATPGPRPGPLRQSSSAHVLPLYRGPESQRRLSRRTDGAPSTFVRHTYAQQVPGPRMPASSARPCRHISDDQENEFDPVALGMGSELHQWRAAQTNGEERWETLDDTPPRRGRYDQYLE